MLLLHIFSAIPAAVAALPGLSRRTPFQYPDNCRFNLGSTRQYDLCPLLSGTEVPSLAIKDERDATYLFQFGDSPGDHCASGPRVCVFPGEPSESDVISDAYTVEPVESGESITLQFSGPERITARLQLVCASRAHLPTYSGTEDAVPLFTWRTNMGCPDSVVHSLEDESGEKPAEDGDNSDQLLEDGRQRNSRRSTAIILFLLSFAIISLSYLSYKHPQRITQLFQRLPLHVSLPSLPNSLKPAGESRLMRWAHEELELDDSEDFMVNGLGADALDDDESTGDEQIPLKPSPRQGLTRDVKTYGSAPRSPFW
ncbi:hypothetical protein FB45DRAFT_928129 [Roridomyces roridus]|uniref:Autophagy-related protein 27 n=1 Tax=Roridomyces roridus TaxID=1738132 RepID=A0AAD7BH86_9AGAR|nr:hypothetical protein FB45DRAFT_928129 [Roridomyces roridus]